jgi:single-strand DNA-binding protein
MSLANVSIVGNLIKPPELMSFASGRVKTTLVVAVNNLGKRQRKLPAANSYQSEIYRVECWGKLAQLCSDYLSKGNQVTITGRLIFEHWTDRQGNERITPLIEASQVAFPPKLKVMDAESSQMLEDRYDKYVDLIDDQAVDMTA